MQSNAHSHSLTYLSCQQLSLPNIHINCFFRRVKIVSIRCVFVFCSFLLNHFCWSGPSCSNNPSCNDRAFRNSNIQFCLFSSLCLCSCLAVVAVLASFCFCTCRACPCRACPCFLPSAPISIGSSPPACDRAIDSVCFLISLKTTYDVSLSSARVCGFPWAPRPPQRRPTRQTETHTLLENTGGFPEPS